MKSSFLAATFVLFLLVANAGDTNFRVLVMNKMNREPIAGAKVTLQEVFSLRTYNSTTNDSGFATFEIDLTMKYRLDVSKDAAGSSVAFMGYSYMLSDKDFSSGRAFEVELEKIKRNDFGLLTAMYFDYKKSDLNPDNKTSLDNAINMLKQYPTLRMEIGIHADCRESESITGLRADAIGKYITEKGFIKQVSVKKYYNTKPLNSCDCYSSLVPCSDEKYTENRRAEFKLLSF
jgi:outer membrane protein OmpA-like peptidoglycan-associated protein